MFDATGVWKLPPLDAGCSAAGRPLPGIALGEFWGHNTYTGKIGNFLCPPAMARLARVVVPGMPHHVTQRGNRRQPTFFRHDDYEAYLELMADRCREEGVAIWAYCLMPNHVHLIAVPETEEALARAVGEAHRRYTRRINFRENWRGYLWQGRFASFVMDEPCLLAAARYVELNPLRASLVADAAARICRGNRSSVATSTKSPSTGAR